MNHIRIYDNIFVYGTHLENVPPAATDFEHTAYSV